MPNVCHAPKSRRAVHKARLALTPTQIATTRIGGVLKRNSGLSAGRNSFDRLCPLALFGIGRSDQAFSRRLQTLSAREGSTVMIEDRRTALISLARVAVTGAGVVLSGCAKANEKDGGGNDEVTANEDLMREHGILRRILIIYRELAPKLVANAAAVDATALASATKLFQTFGERYHEQLLEEQHIFPIVRKAGGEAAGLVDILLAQHGRGREITAYILDRTKSGRIGMADAEPMARTLTAFSRMYEPHAAREDTIVFPAFKKAVGPKGYDELGDQFEDIERKEFGGDGFDIAVDQVAGIERRLGTADLAAFTAPAVGKPAT
jgi:hemerythrin-like domain-containing protein